MYIIIYHHLQMSGVIEGYAATAALQHAAAVGLPVSSQPAKLVHHTLLGQVPFTRSISHAADSGEATDSATDTPDNLS